MQPVLDEIFATKTVWEGVPLHRSAIAQRDGVFLQDLIGTFKPKVFLEIGCAYGISSLFIGEALRDVGAEKHILIDPNQSTQWSGIGLANLKRAGLDGIVSFHEEKSHIALAELEKQGQRADFAFIDGQHTFDYVLADFFHVDKLLNVGGIVVLDDVTYASIRKVCRYVLTNLPYESIGSRGSQTWKQRVAAWLPFAGYHKPEVKTPDSTLGIGGRLLAMRKLREDEIGDTPSCNRHWTTHIDF